MPSAPPDVAVGNTGHVTHHNTLHDLFQYVDDFQYVRASGGSDSNDGRTWATAKATINGAYNALPSGPGSSHHGTLYLSTGIHDVSSPLPLTDLFRLVGRNVSHDDGGSGTVVRRANVAGMNGRSIFEYPTGIGEVWHHMVTFENLTFHNNRTGSNLPTATSTLKLHYPGMACNIINCYFRWHGLYGVDITGDAETLTIINPGNAGAGAGGGFLISRDQGSGYPSNIAIYGAQFDSGALGTEMIVLEGRATSPNKHFLLSGATNEGNGGTSLARVIRHRPISGQGWKITVESSSIFNTTNAALRLVYEEAGGGVGCDLAVINSRAGLGAIFQSAKYGVTAPVDIQVLGGYKAGNASWSSLV